MKTIEEFKIHRGHELLTLKKNRVSMFISGSNDESDSLCRMFRTHTE